MAQYLAIADKVQYMPFGIDQHNALNDNTHALYQRNIMGGIDSAGVRLALARGTKAWTTTLPSGAPYVNTVSVLITFSSDAADGNPSFSVAPRVAVSLEEDTASATNWESGSTGVEITPYLPDGILSTTQMIVNINVIADNAGYANATIKGNLHWLAIGDA